MNIKELQKRKGELIKAVKAAKTSDELDGIRKELEKVSAEIDLLRSKGSILEGLGGDGGEKHLKSVAATLGQHFVKTSFDALPGRDGGRRSFAISAPAYEGKAAGVMTTPASEHGALTTAIPDPVEGPRFATNVGDLFNVEPITAGNSVTWWVEQAAVEGGFAAVGENEKKPQVSWEYDEVSATLKKVAGHYKVSDEVLEDAPRLAAAIDRRGIYLHELAEADQYVNGNGTGKNMVGLANTSGIQTLSAAKDLDFDVLLEALGRVDAATGLMPDAILLSPTDYYKIVGTKDKNGQYLAGGPVFGTYGNGDAPNLFRQVRVPFWDTPTYTTPVLAAGTAFVGAFKLGGTVYRKNGVIVSVFNQNEDDPVNNRVTIVVESRSILAVERPAAFVKVTAGE